MTRVTTNLNIEWFLFFCFRIIFPVLLMIVLPLLPIMIFNKELIDSGLSLFISNEDQLKGVSTILSEYNINLMYLLMLLIFVYLTKFFYKKNGDKLFNSNGNVYYNYFYIFFWLAANFLGFKKIQLAGIPLNMQFKIVLRGTFEEIITDSWKEHYIESIIGPTVEKSKKYESDCVCNRSLNLIISDTYEVKDESIPNEFRKNTYVHIKSGNLTSQHRYDDDKLVQKVREIVLEARRKGYTEICVFSSANPKNNLNIINSSFRFFGRANEIKLYIMQLDSAMYRKKYRVI